MVARVREGVGLRAVAREFRVTLSMVQRWVARAGDLSLDEVDWADRASGCRVSPQRTRAGLEARVLQVRKSLQTQSDLDEFGAAAIPRELHRRQQAGGSSSSGNGSGSTRKRTVLVPKRRDPVPCQPPIRGGFSCSFRQ